MPLGAARINTLSKVLSTPAADTSRTTGFIDVTTTGDTELSNAQYKFNTGTRGGSILFDGSGDHLDCDTSFNLGTGDFTMETYFRSASESVFHIIFDHRDATSDDAVTLVVHDNAQGGNSLTPYLFVNNTKQIIGTTTLNSGDWHHLAVVRSSGVFRLYVDGTSEGGTYSNSNSFTTQTPLRISGNSMTGSSPVNGYLDEVRISDTARFTSNFTPDSSAYGSDNNTLLLLHGDGPYGSNGNNHIVDDIGDLRPLDIHIEQNVTQNSGSAASISTAQSKFGGSSLRLNDNNSHCQYVSPAWGSAFTIEFWFRADSVSAGTQWMAGVWGGTPHGGFNWIVGLSNATVKTYFYTTAGAYSLNNATIGTASANTWHHVAITWDGSTYRTFLDGTMGGTASDSNAPAFDQWQVTWVGTVGGTADTFAGYIDEYRQSDTARYTSNFTPSGSAFTNDSNTKVLLHFDGTNGDTITTDDAQATIDAVSIPASTNYANTSTSFSGSGQNLTISFWFKGDTDPASFSRFFSVRQGSTNTYFIVMRDDSNQKLAFFSSNAGTSPNVRWWFSADVGQNIFDGNWHHIMVATDHSSTSNSRIYWDGVSKTITHNNTNSTSAVNWSSYDNIGIGGRAAGTNRIQGDYCQLWIDDSYNSDINKFYDKNLGPIGIRTGLSRPLIYHFGNTSTFVNNNGTDSYTLSTVGSGTITDATGPETS